MRDRIALAGIVGALLVTFAATASGQSEIVGWGLAKFDSGLSRGPYVQVSAHLYHTLALRPDGTIAAWGSNFFGELDVPQLPPGIAYANVTGGKGWIFSIASRSDGTVMG